MSVNHLSVVEQKPHCEVSHKIRFNKLMNELNVSKTHDIYLKVKLKLGVKLKIGIHFELLQSLQIL